MSRLLPGLLLLSFILIGLISCSEENSTTYEESTSISKKEKGVAVQQTDSVKFITMTRKVS